MLKSNTQKKLGSFGERLARYLACALALAIAYELGKQSVPTCHDLDKHFMPNLSLIFGRLGNVAGASQTIAFDQRGNIIGASIARESSSYSRSDINPETLFALTEILQDATGYKVALNDLSDISDCRLDSPRRFSTMIAAYSFGELRARTNAFFREPSKYPELSAYTVRNVLARLQPLQDDLKGIPFRPIPVAPPISPKL